MSEHETQNQLMLRLLEGGEWVPLPRIVAAGIYRASARKYDLIRAGHDVECQTSRVAGKVHSFYRLRKQAA